MISRLFKLRPYSGGPHFERLSTFCFELEGTVLELTLPASDAKWQNPPRPLNYPFNTGGWFEQNSKRPNINSHVHLHTEIWYYFPVRLKRLVNLMITGTNEPIGNLSISARLHKLHASNKLELTNPRCLVDYIKWEYADYYESPEVGASGKGQNFRYKKKYGQYLAEKGESYREQYDAAMNQYLEPTPKHFDLIEFGGGYWTCFELGKEGCIPAQHYCIPLSEFYYIHIDIEPTFHLHYRETLKSDMLRTAEWLLQHVKITPPGNVSGPLPPLPTSTT